MAQTPLLAPENYAILSEDHNFSKKRAKLFLHFLSETGKIGYSAQLAGFKDADSLYRRRKHDPSFAQAWAEAMDIAGDRFEAEAVRRGVEGVAKDVYYKGEVVGQEQVYSDGLLSKLLDGAKRDKYQPRKESVTSVNVQVGLAVVPMTALHLEEWERDSIEMHQNQRQIVDATATPVAEQSAPAGQKIVRA